MSVQGRIVYEVARVVSESAHHKIAECIPVEDSEWEEEEHTGVHLRSGLLLALVTAEVERGTTKEELVSYLETIYDTIHNPPRASRA